MRTNKKGFTIVELVIVIAVIAILAGVMIPTFGGVIEKANESKLQQVAAAAYKDAYAVALSNGSFETDETVENEENGFTFVFNNDGTVKTVTVDTTKVDAKFADYTVTVSNGAVVLTEKTADSSAS